MSHGRHVDRVGIRRVHHNAGNRMGIFQAEMVPRLAAISRAPDAVADGRTLPVVGLPGADIDDVRIGRCDGDGADRLVGHVVELRLPVIARVGRLP